MAKKHKKKEDFIQKISMMGHNELNDYIKRHGPGVKPVVMCRIVDKEKNEKKE
jgi:hypothetical protein